VRARCPEPDIRRFPRRGRHAFAVALFGFALAIAALPSMLRAAPSTYTGEAPVDSQSDDDRLEALKIALANVVIDQTGDSGALSRPDVAAALAKADRYMLQFRYKQNPGAADTGSPRLTLIVEFDAAAVDEMLQRLGLASAGTGGAPIDATPTDVTVWIGGIRSAEDYARVIAYLGRSNFVKSTQPREARGDGMLVRLSLVTDLRHFLDALTLERTLSVVNGSPPVDGIDATLALSP
jgi:hypothetical protein